MSHARNTQAPLAPSWPLARPDREKKEISFLGGLSSFLHLDMVPRRCRDVQVEVQAGVTFFLAGYAVELGSNTAIHSSRQATPPGLAF